MRNPADSRPVISVGASRQEGKKHLSGLQCAPLRRGVVWSRC